MPRRRFLSATAALLAGACWGCASPANALGARVDVAVIDRDTGAPLEVYSHRGRSHVAGRPGSRYAIRISNRTGERILAVMAVDGVNIVTGETADWNQGGYVLAPWQSYEIAGWRKSDREVAAFEFTSLPDSYAARTGRPHDVGVVGVAVFDERIRYPVPAAPPYAYRSDGAKSESRAGRAGADAQAEVGAAEGRASADSAGRAAAPESAERLGTGHGAREHSHASSTSFIRRSARPVEVISIHYDRWENLVRAGVIPQFGGSGPRPFPKSARHDGFVPDPPAR
jgi:hypothetical protein